MKITNKMLAEAFGKSEQNFKQIQKELKEVYIDAYKFRELQKLSSSIDVEQINDLNNLVKILKQD